MNFKTEGEIFNDLKTRITNYIPELTDFSPGSIIRAILRVIASGIRMLYVTLEYLYWNIFPTYADREALRRYYEDWGLTWDNPDTETARKTVLNMFRQKGIGTKKWFEDSVLLNFDEVDNVEVEVGLRGINTVDITVSYHNLPVPDDLIQEIQNFFDSDDKKICGIDVFVKTIEIQEVTSSEV